MQYILNNWRLRYDELKFVKSTNKLAIDCAEGIPLGKSILI